VKIIRTGQREKSLQQPAKIQNNFQEN